MSGLEFITKLKKIQPSPVIVTTYESNPKRAADLLNLVADEVVRKPFDERQRAARAYRMMLPPHTRDKTDHDELRSIHLPVTEHLEHDTPI